MTIIRLPHQFDMRPFQRNTFNALFKDNYRQLIDVIHRRAGKTKNVVNVLTAAAMRRIGVYYHIFPQLNQARRVVWNGIDKEGKRYLDHMPRRLIADTNKTEMRIDFINGSILQLVGSDNYNSLMGGNPVGIAYDEYTLQHPLAAHYMSPIIAENGGFEYYTFTPRGHNHGYELYNNAVNDPDFFVQKLTVDDTGLIPQEEIERRRRMGVPEEIIQQEYYCSFDASLVGAYYGQGIKEAYEEGRIRIFEIDKRLPVFSYWDIGMRDKTAIWLMQFDGQYCRMIYYYENHNLPLRHYIEKLKEIEKQFGIRYKGHFAPHDIKKRDWFSGLGGMTLAQNAGIIFNQVPNVGLQEGIDTARERLRTVIIHEQNCKLGIQCLKEYTKKWDDEKKIFADRPDHNWASHGADAFRYFAVSWSPRFANEQSSRQIEYQIER